MSIFEVAAWVFVICTVGPLAIWLIIMIAALIYYGPINVYRAIQRKYK